MISKRLSEIVNLINEDKNIADVGSDHGYVLIELRKRGFRSKLLGVENKKAPFLRLEKNIRLHSLNDIEVSLSDGLDKVDNTFSTIIIAGMGFETIKEIVLKNQEKLDCIDTFVIDSHTDNEKIRSFFVSLGYFIDDESIIFEDNIYYDLVRFKKGKGKAKYTKDELAFGPFNLKNKSGIFINMLNEEIRKNEKIISKINDKNSARSIELSNRNSYLRGILDENKINN